MNIKTLIACVFFLILTGPVANADETDVLVQLDKEWGEAQGPKPLKALLADDILALGSSGLADKAQLLKDAASGDAPTGPYVAGDYEVRFLGKDLAVMVHSSSTPDPHWSMHLWQKRDGKWQVAATASVPTEE
ncbi:MAG: nuclear transport factor 2 family protein [Lysobacterales bacterium]